MINKAELLCDVWGVFFGFSKKGEFLKAIFVQCTYFFWRITFNFLTDNKRILPKLKFTQEGVQCKMFKFIVLWYVVCRYQVVQILCLQHPKSNEMIKCFPEEYDRILKQTYIRKICCIESPSDFEFFTFTYEDMIIFLKIPTFAFHLSLEYLHLFFLYLDKA